MYLYTFFLNVSTHIRDVCVCVYICMYWQLYMYSCECSLSSNPIDLCTVITCECWQDYGKTALLWASEHGHAETVRVLVELGASVEAVDETTCMVIIHAHALAYACCIKHVSGIMRMTMIIMSHAGVYMYIYTCICIYTFICRFVYSYVCMYICIYININVYIYIYITNHHVCICIDTYIHTYIHRYIDIDR